MTERAIEIATEQGHTIESDPPAAMTAARRWTCTVCDAAILDYNGNIYGSAKDRRCQAAASPSEETQ